LVPRATGQARKFQPNFKLSIFEANRLFAGKAVKLRRDKAELRITLLFELREELGLAVRI
jgi:hypothetical protein